PPTTITMIRTRHTAMPRPAISWAMVSRRWRRAEWARRSDMADLLTLVIESRATSQGIAANAGGQVARVSRHQAQQPLAVALVVDPHFRDVIVPTLRQALAILPVTLPAQCVPMLAIAGLDDA